MLKACLLVAALLSPLAASAATLTVAVAANVQYAFSDLAAAFSDETGHQIRPVYNSSGKFVAQILNGAPFDVFLSADMEYPERLHRDGFAASEPKVYAYGSLVLWTMRPLPLDNWQRALQSDAVRKIAVANPKVAPYGRETMRALAALKLDRALMPKLVYGESVAQTNQYIHSGSADAGFTAKSVVLSPEMRGMGSWIDVPKDTYQPIAQGAVILAHGQARNAQASQQFHRFLHGDKARAILQRHGYLLP